MAKRSGREIAEKHRRRFAEAVPDMKDAMDRMTENPAQKAKANIEKMRANWNKAMDDGKIARGFDRVKLDDIKEAYKANIDKGATTLARHVEKNAHFYEELMDYQDSYLAKIKDMPSTTLEDNKQRMIANMENMAKFRRS